MLQLQSNKTYVHDRFDQTVFIMYQERKHFQSVEAHSHRAIS